MKAYGFKRGNELLVCHKYDTDVRIWIDGTKHYDEPVNVLVYTDRKEAEKFARKIGAEIFEINLK